MAVETTMDLPSVLSTYKSLDLPSLQSLLASLVEPLTALQTNSLSSRKKLAEQTREFKKLKDEEKVESYKPLLKAYQGEIDELTKRSRDAEGGVRKVEEKLRGVADPYLVLDRVLDQMGGMGDVEKAHQENDRLRKDNEQLRERLEATTALQTDRDQLAERLASFQSDLQEAKQSVESEVAARFDERLTNAAAREAELSRSLALAQEQLKQLRTSHETTTQRLLSSSAGGAANGNGGATGGSGSAAAELGLLAQDLQRANERTATVERRNEQLREEVERVKSGRAEAGTIEKLQNRLRAAEEERTKIQAHLESADQGRKADAVAHQEALSKLQQQITARTHEIATLRAKLDGQSDYEEIKRELGIIRYVEFSNGLDDDDDDEDEDDDDKARTTTAKPLETLLLEKNKKLQDELTTLRVAHNDLTQQFSTSLVELQKTKGEADRLAKLVEKLENDLLEVGVGVVGHGEGARKKHDSAAGAPMSAEAALEELDKLGKGEVLPNSSRTSLNGSSSSAQSTASPSTPAPAKPSTASNDSSVLPIIVSQRDRFRTRNAELEEELRKQFELITSLRTEIKTLQTDNLSLYEKVRYLQSYATSSSSSSSAPAHLSRFGTATTARNEYPPSSYSQHTKVPMNIASGSHGDGDEKYRAKYEQSMNPFEAFRGREQSRAMSSLNPLERLLHMISSIILQDRRMRIAFMIYAVGMHLFIFAILLDYTFFGGSSGATISVGSGTNCAAPVEPVVR